MIRRIALRQTDAVPGACTCGAIPPPDANFCHKCGRPLKEDLLHPRGDQGEDQSPGAPTSPKDLKTEQWLVEREVTIEVPVSLQQPVASRIAFLVGLLASLVSNTPLLWYGCPLWLVGSGYLSVALYRRRTGELPPGPLAARLGFLTGLFAFMVSVVLFTASAVLLTLEYGSFAEGYRHQLESLSASEQVINQAMEILEEPVTLVLILLFGLLFLFIAYTLLGTLGGALASRFLAGKNSTGHRS